MNVTSVYKYIGLHFTPKHSWYNTNNKLATQAKIAMYSKKSYARIFGNFSLTDYFKLFDSMVKPILTTVLKFMELKSQIYLNKPRYNIVNIFLASTTQSMIMLH